MQLLYWASDHLNFGDDLNLWLWDDLVPDYRTQRCGEYLLGVGTVLTREVLTPERVAERRPTHVLGSGVGYDLCPSPHERSHLRLHSVRGPMSARALELDPATGVLDPAALLPRLRRFASVGASGDGSGNASGDGSGNASGNTPGDPSGHASGNASRRVAFVPHWQSDIFGTWDRVCERAGIRYITPCQDAENAIREIAGSSLVLAESMHGAIVADAFRIPWVPLSSSRGILAFKWMDWAMSLELPYRPVTIPLSSFVEKIQKRQPRAQGVGEVTEHEPESVYREWKAIQARRAAAPPPSPPAAWKRGMKRVVSYLQRHPEGFPQARMEDSMTDRAARALQRAAESTPYLSDERVLERQIGRLQDTIDAFRKPVAAP